MIRNVVLSAAAALLTLACLWVFGFVWFVTDVAASKAPKAASSEAIIVLTGGKDRIETGLGLLHSVHAPNMLITGVHTYFQDHDLQQHWRHQGTIPCCITLGYEATDTMGNASETKRWITQNKVKSLTLVTSNYHMPRSKMLFRAAMPQVDIIPYPVIASDTQPWSGQFWVMTFKEYHKTLLTWLDLHVKDHAS